MSIPWTPNTGKIETYFNKIKEAEIPDKVDRAWVKSAGWRSGDDYRIVPIWKTLGFLDSNNVPTDLWRKYKAPITSQVTLAQAIRHGYSSLFKMYSDAWRKDDEAIYSHFVSVTGESEKKVKQMVTIFKNLVEMADFEAEPVSSEEPSKTDLKKKVEIPIEDIKRKMEPSIHINIELHLPATDDINVYDKLFESMKKHLLTDES